uniref:3'-5' exonuclease n=1 Tax=Amycolatopsis sp. CA-096443 TaxID=3239919 RepID=UPI003F4980DE
MLGCMLGVTCPWWWGALFVMPVYRDVVPEHLMTVAQLRRTGSMPADLDDPGGWWEREFDGDLWRTPLYDVRLARSASALVEASLPEAPDLTARRDAIRWAGAALRDERMVVLDTELTDFQGRVIEIAVVAMDGTVLLETLVNPRGAVISAHAQDKHGITAAMLVGAPTMEQVWPRLDAVLRGKTVIAWNAPFDQARLRTEHQHVNPGTAEPAWLAGPWPCAMRQHAAWSGLRNATGSGFLNHKLDGGHRAAGDCRAVLDRLTIVAGTKLPVSPVQRYGPADVNAINQAWPQVLDTVGARSRSCRAMLTSADVDHEPDRTVVLAHRSAPLARRLAADPNITIIRDAVATVLGTGWSVRVQLPAADPAPEPALVATGTEPYRDWIDSNHGAHLESWIELNPRAICDKVIVEGESRNDAAWAFWAVHHTARCAPEDPCRTILRLADEGHFVQASDLAEERVLRP